MSAKTNETLINEILVSCITNKTIMNEKMISTE